MSQSLNRYRVEIALAEGFTPRKSDSANRQLTLLLTSSGFLWFDIYPG